MILQHPVSRQRTRDEALAGRSRPADGAPLHAAAGDGRQGAECADQARSADRIGQSGRKGKARRTGSIAALAGDHQAELQSKYDFFE